MPYVREDYFRDFMQTIQHNDELKRNLLAIDNSVSNNGIMVSHNFGAQVVVEKQLDWLIVASAAIRFGRPQGNDFLEELDKAGNEELVLEAAGVYGWHLIAFSRKVLESVGKWDENFTPYGYDDLDYSYRIQLAFGMDKRSQLWRKVNVAVGDMGMSHSLKHGVQTQPEERLRDYYIRKWGGMSGKEYFTHPFNDMRNAVNYWPDTNTRHKHDWNISI